MMQVKKYVARTFGEALLQAKNELGSEAMIVESKRLYTGGFFGFFRQQLTELTVAIDDEKIRPGYMARPAERAAEKAADKTAAHLANLEREMATLRGAISRMAERGMAPNAGLLLKGYGRQVFDELVARGVDEEPALALAQKLGTEAEGSDEALRRELSRLIGPCTPITVQPGKRKVVALIGPTGVGKTTTLAKLAAQFTLERGLNVALVTSDTFRIAAIEQLKTYADILGVPLYAVDTPSDAARAMKETAHCDLVLTDTGGRNHRDAQRMKELQELLAVLRPDETHLVFSLTANPKDAFEALDAYLPMGVNRLTFTKLDEASSPGLLLNLRLRCNQPVSYLTNGQSVPDDLLPADRADFTKILMGA
ncbi:MAG TPA: flagellar biosynthesis protein FlhF [Symbiobacteriaceae bacterium]|nr:flagellar biosynthesis protein FlhF [Symbiobacteriaceae bacterium]